MRWLSLAALPWAAAMIFCDAAASSPASARMGSGYAAMLDPTPSLAHPASERALELLGSGYRWGGSSATGGMDCSGFIYRSYRDATGLRLPRTAFDMARSLPGVLPHRMRAGDLVFFNTRGRRHSHVGLYLGGGSFAHAPRSGATARIDSLSTPYWLRAFDGARRPPTEADRLGVQGPSLARKRLGGPTPPPPNL